ncbi:MAG: TIGR00730 family Rossman fold protein [Acidobacteriota bacterium]|jgi:uncharacterized protein (TIGR00730 family)
MHKANAGRTPFDVHDSELSSLIDTLMDRAPAHEDRKLVREILVTGVKLLEDGADRGDLKILRTTVKEMRHAFRVFSRLRGHRKVSIFGSARSQPSDPEYKAAQKLGRLLAKAGFMVITGAGDGVMGAAHQGAGRERSIGLNIQLPFEQHANPTIEGDFKLMNFRYFFTRKLFFVKESDAIILMPGGFGTLDEGFETLTLLQTGRSDPKPAVLLDPAGRNYWEKWLDFVRTSLVGQGFISPEDLKLFELTRTPERACASIRRFYHRYHSLRYVEGRKLLIIRMNGPLSATHIDRLNGRFSDILAGGRIEATEPHPEEDDEREVLELPRLALHFDQYHFGRLRELIDAINRA